MIPTLEEIVAPRAVFLPRMLLPVNFVVELEKPYQVFFYDDTMEDGREMMKVGRAALERNPLWGFYVIVASFHPVNMDGLCVFNKWVAYKFKRHEDPDRGYPPKLHHVITGIDHITAPSYEP